MSKKQKIVFFFPWQEVSGGPYYLIRLANALSKDEKYDVYYVEYEDGLTDSLRDKNVKKIIYSQGFVMPIKVPIILITPIYWANVVPCLHPQSKIVFFNWHYCCIPVLKECWRISDEGMHNFLSLVNQRDACFFCDYTHWQGQNTSEIVFKKLYVPIIVPEKKNIANYELVDRHTVNIAFLGRLCMDKIFSLIDLLDALENVDESIFGRILVHVIGDGPERWRIEERKWSSKIEIIFLGTVTSEKLNKYLCDKVDILFAMGTSVLEGAALHLPSVIIPHNTVEFHSGEFVYLHESKDYSLGWLNTQMADMNLPIKQISEILTDIYQNNKKKAYGDLDYLYCIKNHKQNIELLKKAINISKLRYDEFYSTIENQFYFVKCIQLFKKRIFWVYVDYRQTKILISLRNKINLLSIDKASKTIYFLKHKIPFIHIYNWEYGKILFVGKVPVFVLRTQDDYQY